MDITYIESLFNTGLWVNSIETVDSELKTISFKKNDYKTIEELINQHIGKKHFGRAFNWISLLLYLDQDNCINFIKRKGLFRPSKYNYNISFITKIVNSILDNNNVFKLNNENYQYLISIKNYFTIAPQIESEISKIRNFILKNQNTFFKSIIVFTDLIFMRNHEPSNVGPHKIVSFSKGEIAEAASFLIYQFQSTFNINKKHFNYIDEKGLLNNTYSDIFLKAINIRCLQEVEILIDSFNYSFQFQDDKFKIECNDDFFGRSIQLGFIRTELQKYNMYYHISDSIKHAVSISDLSLEFFNEYKDKFFEIKTEPISRLVFSIPDIPELWDLFNKNNLFQEDIYFIAETNLDLHSNITDLQNFEVGDKLSLFDILKIQRLWNFIRLCFINYINVHIRSKTEMVLRSILPVFSIDNFNDILKHLIPSESLKSFYEIFSWDKDSFFDIQYQPIIINDNWLIIPLNIFGSSNLVRNSLFETKKRIFHDGSFDPLTKQLSESFKKHTTTIFDQIEYHYKGKNGDIDVLVKINDTLFVFEIKNSLLPASIAELRTSYDYLLKAENQLNSIMELLTHNDFKLYLESIIQCSIDDVNHIIPCIITGNRLFYGWKQGPYPVFYITEIINFIISQKIIVNDQDYFISDIHLPFEEQLKKFINNNTIHRLTHDTMSKQNRYFSIGEANVIETKHKLNLEMLHSEIIDKAIYNF